MTTSDNEDVTLALSDQVALVTLNRPAARNALSAPMVAELRRIFASLDDDDDVAAIVLTGTDPAFCAGIDLNELSAGNYGEEGMSSPSVRQNAPWPRLKKPVIGAVNGFAVTGGLEVALHCDVLLASERARFADLHAKFGMMPTWGMSVLLTRAVGPTMARRMSLSGQFIDAPTALRVGLVAEVTAHEDLVPTALQLASDIADSNQATIQATLANLRQLEEPGLAGQFQQELDGARHYRETSFDPEEIARRRESRRHSGNR